jgi:hypothetical protein
MGAILVLYHAPRAPLRRAVADHLYSIRRYSGRPCIYVNLAVRPVPSWIARLDIDLVVLHTILLATRWQPEVFRDVARRLRPIQRLHCPRIAIPQDEFLNTDMLVDFLRGFRVEHVFTTLPPDEWETVYGPLMADGAALTRVLTGYLEPRTVRRINQLAAKTREREIDIGYRSWKPEPWLGRHGMLKGWIAERFEDEGRHLGLRVDISMDPADTLLGDAWYRFLLRCRFTIGVEGGASILDRDGRVRACVDAFVMDHPDASFEEIERACFAGLDGRFNLRALSPRHLEACATRTPQILVEGSYNGILEAGRHYIPLHADFDNLSQVLKEVTRREHGREMAERAYRDVVASGRYTYESFVVTLLANAAVHSLRRPVKDSIPIRAFSAWGRAADRPSWALVRLRQHLNPIARETLRRTGLLRVAKQVRGRRRLRSERKV